MVSFSIFHYARSEGLDEQSLPNRDAIMDFLRVRKNGLEPAYILFRSSSALYDQSRYHTIQVCCRGVDKT